jgi:hypothetical protein
MKKAAQQILRFKGFISPRYTQVPDELFDALMAYLSGAELKVLLYIIRRTFGFKKDSDHISLRQICNGIKTREGDVLDKGTGLSLSTVQIALKGPAGALKQEPTVSPCERGLSHSSSCLKPY